MHVHVCVCVGVCKAHSTARSHIDLIEMIGRKRVYDEKSDRTFSIYAHTSYDGQCSTLYYLPISKCFRSLIFPSELLYRSFSIPTCSSSFAFVPTHSLLLSISLFHSLFFAFTVPVPFSVLHSLSFFPFFCLSLNACRTFLPIRSISENFNVNFVHSLVFNVFCLIYSLLKVYEEIYFFGAYIFNI